MIMLQAAMLSVMNFTGRVIWGVIAERLGRKSFYIVANIVQAVALGLMALWIHLDNFGLWLFCFFIVGSVYGGAHGVLPAFLNTMFGSNIAGALHGTLLTVWAMSDIVGVPIFSAIISQHKVIVNGKSVGSPEGYMINAYWLCAMPLLAAVALIFLDTSAVDRTLRKAFKECRVRVCSRVCVIKCLDRKEQEREYVAYKDALKVHHRVRAGTKTIFDPTPELELQSIPGIVGIYDVHGRSSRALSSRGPSMRELLHTDGNGVAGMSGIPEGSPAADPSVSVPISTAARDSEGSNGVDATLIKVDMSHAK